MDISNVLLLSTSGGCYCPKMKRKFLVAVLVAMVSCFISNAYIPNVNYKIRDFCIEDSGVSADIVANLLANPVKDLTDEESCYLHCALTETGFLSEDGDIIVEKFLALRNDEPELDVDCLNNLNRIERCNEMMALRKCHA